MNPEAVSASTRPRPTTWSSTPRRANGEEVRLHPFDEILDAALLLCRPGIAELRVKPDLGGKAPEGGIPPRLPLGVAAERHRLHVVEDPGPGTPPQPSTISSIARRSV